MSGTLGKIILKTLKTYYPNTNINIGEEDINNILDKAKISKTNYRKEDISKIIKILKHHIEIGKQEIKNNNIRETNKFEQNYSISQLTNQSSSNTFNMNDLNSNISNLNSNISEDKSKDKEPFKYTPIFSDMEKENNGIKNQNLDYINNLNELQEREKHFKEKKMDIMPPELRVKEFMEEEKNEFKHHIIIDSKDRNFIQDPKPNEYSIMCGVPDDDSKKGYIVRNYEDVVSVELTHAIIKQTSGVSNATDETDTPPYMLIEIEEFGSRFEGTNDAINKSFAKLYYYDFFENGNSKYRIYSFVGDTCMKVFKPRRNINRISIKIRNFDGEMYNFGDEDDSSSVSMNSFHFVITTLQKNFVSNFIEKTN